MIIDRTGFRKELGLIPPLATPQALFIHSFILSSFMHSHCLVDDILPTAAIEIVLIANHLGMHTYGLATSQPDALKRHLHEALTAGGAQNFVIHAIRDVPL